MGLDLEMAHVHSSENEAEISLSVQCGCFYCKESYSARRVADWLEEGTPRTARCPLCGIDSVIGDKSGLPVGDKAFLQAMYDHWFDTPAEFWRLE